MAKIRDMKVDKREFGYILLVFVLLLVIVVLGSAVSSLGKTPTGKYTAPMYIEFESQSPSGGAQPPEPAGVETGFCIGSFCIDLLPIFDECSVQIPIFPGFDWLGLSENCTQNQITHAGCVLGQCVELPGSGANECTLNNVCSLDDKDKALENVLAFALWAVEADTIVIEDEDIQQGTMVTQTGNSETGQLTIQGAGITTADINEAQQSK